MSLLRVEELTVELAAAGGPVHAVRGVSLELVASRRLALVGESGCGKSMTALGLLGLTPAGSRVGGRLYWRGQRLAGPRAMAQFRGREIGLVGQNPMAAFNPTQRVGWQVAEMLQVHRGWGRRRAWHRAVELLEAMQLTDPERQARHYPFEFSGGMLQRAAIAMAVACEPELLIADEPTTALDVTVQAQVLALLDQWCRQRDMGLLLITHDLGVVAQMADEVAVMYAGQVVEQGPVAGLFARSGHPYSDGLKRALPERVAPGQPLQVLAGSPPDLRRPPPGCGFHPRCTDAMEVCETGPVPVFGWTDGHWSRCWRHHPRCRDEGGGES